MSRMHEQQKDKLSNHQHSKDKSDEGSCPMTAPIPQPQPVSDEPQTCAWCGAQEPTSCEVCEQVINTLRTALQPKGAA